MPNCSGLDKRLNVHHIKRWADFPELRYVHSNGITLCSTCHDSINGQEESYEELFTRLLGGSFSSQLYRIMRGLDET